MAATIKGITVRIGSDTTGLQAALSDVNQHARDIQSELRQVERLLKFNPHDTELLAQKQQLLADQVENTRKKLDTLKIAQEQVNEQFRKGEISQDQYRAFQRELVKTESQLKDYEKQLRAVNLQNHEFNQRMQEMGGKLQDVGERLAGVGKDLSLKLTAPLAAVGTVAAKSAIDFESAFAGVRKTVDATEDEFAALAEGIREMSKEIPAAATEIAGVAEAAGQLGIANEHILSFTRTMIDLGEATNMSADDAATALARLANITQMPQSEFDRLGSTIVALGNNLATTEAEIVNMGLRLAGAGEQVGMTEAEILSLAGALSSVGIEAEAGGSAISRLLVNMQLAVETGSDDLLNFASVAGMTAERFQQAFQEDAAGALIAFIEGLQTAEERGMSAIKVLDDMGITEIRLRDALLRAAGAGDLFAESIQLGTQAWDENTALTEEAAQRYETTASKLEIMRNQLQDVAITFGETLLPPLLQIVEKVGAFAEWLGRLSPETQKLVVTIAVLAAAIGPVVLVLGKLISAVGVLLPFLGTLGSFIAKTLVPAILGLSTPVVATVGAIVGLALVAYEVYRAWDEVKTALGAIWELIKASAAGMGLNVQITFERMKAAVIGAIDSMLDRLGVLEKLPFGVGKNFEGLRQSVSNAADESMAKVAELEQKLAENSERMRLATEGTKVAFGDLGTKVADDVKGVISAITGQTAAIEQAQAQQTAIIADQSALRTDILNDEINQQIQAMYDGMTATVDSWIQAGYDSEGDVREMAETLAQGMADYLVGQSPPKEGPLSDIDEGGRRVVEAWAEGIIHGAPAVEFAAHLVASVTERALDQADRFRGRWTKAATDIGKAFEQMAVSVGKMWTTNTGSWEEILLSFLGSAIDHILIAAVGAMGIAELVSQALANMWNPLGWIAIGGLLIALAAIQRELQKKLKTKTPSPKGPGGESSKGSGGGASSTSPSGGGRQVSEITGPTRDLLTDLLSPLAHLGSIVAPIQDIRAILDARLPNFNAMQFGAVGVGGGANVVFEPGAIVVHSSAAGAVELSNDLLDAIERGLATRMAFGFRGQGR